MGEVVNLNKFRKRKQREQAARSADDNRRRHGRTKAERRAEQGDRARAHQRLEGHRLGPERPDPERPDPERLEPERPDQNKDESDPAPD